MKRFIWVLVIAGLLGFATADEVDNRPLTPVGATLSSPVHPYIPRELPVITGDKTLELNDEYMGEEIDTVGYTYYDMQHNNTCGRNIAVDKAGGIHICWMNGRDPALENRHIFYNYIYPDYVLPDSVLTTGGFQAVSSIRSGYTTIALVGLPPGAYWPEETTEAIIEIPVLGFQAEYSMLPDAHTDMVWDGIFRIGGPAGRGGFSGTETGEGVDRAGSGSRPANTYPNATQYEVLIPELVECEQDTDMLAIWPVVEADMDGNIYLASTNSLSDTTLVCGVELGSWIIFHRGVPLFNAVLDSMIDYYDFTESLLLDWQSSINVDLAVDHRSNGRIAAVYGDKWDEPLCPDTAWGSLNVYQIAYRISEDYGLTWTERTTAIGYPDGMPDPETDIYNYIDRVVGWMEDSITGDTIWVALADTMQITYLPWGPSISAVFDNDGVLHIVCDCYILKYEEEDPCHVPLYYGNAVLYWNDYDREIIPIVTIISGKPSLITSGTTEYISAYNQVMDASIAIDRYDNIYIIWAMANQLEWELDHYAAYIDFVEENAGTLTTEQLEEFDSLWSEIYIITEGASDYGGSNNGANLDIYGIAYDACDGMWHTPQNISNTFSPDCAAGECLCELNPTLAERVDDDGYLHIFAILDTDPGQIPREAGIITNSPVIHIPVQGNKLRGGIKEARANKPEKLAIGVYPNPFNATASINWSSPTTGDGRIEIIDITGRIVKSLHSGVIVTGPHSMIWDGTDNGGNEVPSGTYMCKITMGENVASAKLSLIK